MRGVAGHRGGLARARRAAALVVLVATAVVRAPAQEAPPPPLSLTGAVVRQTLDGGRPLAREFVVLHRVNAASAGPVDSMRTDGRGRYAFRVQPESAAFYLVSAHHGGIAYFSPPAGAGDAPPPAEIAVFDTTSADVPLRLQGRHLVVSAPTAGGVRSIIDVFEIQNDTLLTRVAGDANRPTFSALLPDGAVNARVAQGDVSEAGVTIREGRADMYAALSPGIRQLVLTYELPVAAFPLTIPVERATGVLEVLLEETGGRAEGSGVRDRGVVEVDGRRFQRFLGQDVPAHGVLAISLPRSTAPAGALPNWVPPVLLSLFTLGALYLFSRRGASSNAAGRGALPGGAGTGSALVGSPGATRASRPGVAAHPVASAPPRAQVLAEAAAAIDVMLEEGTMRDEATRGALGAYRHSLARELTSILAPTPPGP